MKNVIKEIFIGLLLLLIVILSLGVLFYESIPNTEENIESVSYAPDTSVTKTLQSISEEKEKSEEDKTPGESTSFGANLVSYRIGINDLERYEERKTYESGKLDPFEDYVEDSGGEEGQLPTERDTGSSESTGRLFENKSNK